MGHAPFCIHRVRHIVIAYDLGLNVGAPNGGGITGRIFLDGVPVFAQFIDNLGVTGVHGVLNLSVNVGSKIDFAIDPLGIAGLSGDHSLSARGDGSRFTARHLHCGSPRAHHRPARLRHSRRPRNQETVFRTPPFLVNAIKLRQGS